MLSIEDDRLLEVYEKLTSSELNTADGMPSTICYICVSQLQRCRRFADLASESTNILTRLLRDGFEVTLNNVTAMNLDEHHYLTTTAVHNLTATYYAIDSGQVNVKQEQVAVKEEAAEDGDLIENEESGLGGEESGLDYDKSRNHLENLAMKNNDSNQEQDAVKEEATEDKELIEIEESELDGGGSGLVDKGNNQHLSMKSDYSNPCICDVCNKQCIKGALKRLWNIDTREKINACNRCSKTFNKVGEQQTKTLKLAVNPFICNKCNMSFNQAVTLKQHMLSHTREKPHTSNEYSNAFKLPQHFKQHMVIHTEEKPYACNQCYKTYNHSGSLKTHLLTHTGEKPYICHECSKAYNTASQLKRHMLIHSGKKRHTCNECRKGFHQHQHLRQHMLIHTGEKPYVCNECEKAFNQIGSLKEHMRIHTGERPFICNECNKDFNKRHNLKQHMLIHTKESLQLMQLGFEQY